MEELLSALEGEGTLHELLPLERLVSPGGEADKLAEMWVGKLKPTQLRKVFNRLRAIDRKLKGWGDEEEIGPQVRAELTMLVPELAYAAGRGVINREFYELMKGMLRGDKLRKVRDFRRLIAFLEALLAYHKFYEETKGSGR